MIQAIGLTSVHRRRPRPAVDDLTFEARPGRVTVLLGPKGAGKTSALRLMLELQAGRGVALFRGRPIHRVPRLAREVGVLLGDVPAHPARTARSHLRMLASGVGVPVDRADEVLDVVGLSGLADQRLRLFSLGMDRRLGMAAALLGDPHTFVLDEPAEGLSPREASWLHGLLRGYAEQGGAVLVTSQDTREAARLADRVVSIDDGRLVADQEVTDFARTRLRPRIAVHSPQAERLAAVLVQEARRAGRVGQERGRAPMEVVREGGSRISVYGSSCAEVGEFAYRHGILVHQLADERGDVNDTYPRPPLNRVDGRRNITVARAEPSESAALAPAPDDDYPTLSLRPIASSATRNSPAPRTTATLAPSGTERDPDQAATSLAEEPAEQGDSAPPAPRSHGHGADVATAEQCRTVPLADAETPGETQVSPVSAAAAVSPSSSVSSTPQVSQADGLASTSGALGGSGRSGGETAGRRVGGSSASEGSAGHASSAVPPWLPSRPGSHSSALPPRLPLVARPGPVAPLRYEARRLFGVRTTWLTLAASVLVAAVLSAVLAGTGKGVPDSPDAVLSPTMRMLAGWPAGPAFVLTPAALAAGILGALAFGQEFRYPALAPARTSVPRRLSLLVAKLTVSALLAFTLCLVGGALNAAVDAVLFGSDVFSSGLTDTEWQVQALAVFALAVGCGWAGVLAAGVCRSTLAGIAVVLAVPTLVAPAVGEVFAGSVDGSSDGLPGRLQSVLLMPAGADRWLAVAVRLASQPLGCALALVLCVLLGAYLFTAVRGRVR